MPQEEHETVRKGIIYLITNFDVLLNSMKKVEKDCLKHLLEKNCLDQTINVIKKIQFVGGSEDDLCRMKHEDAITNVSEDKKHR